MLDLTSMSLSKALSKKLRLACSLFTGQLSPSAVKIYEHSMLVAAQKNARGKDRTILNATVPQSEEALRKSAREDAILAELLEQMAQFPEFNFQNNKTAPAAAHS